MKKNWVYVVIIGIIFIITMAAYIKSVEETYYTIGYNAGAAAERKNTSEYTVNKLNELNGRIDYFEHIKSFTVDSIKKTFMADMMKYQQPAIKQYVDALEPLLWRGTVREHETLKVLIVLNSKSDFETRTRQSYFEIKGDKNE